MPFTDNNGHFTKAFQKEKRHCKSIAKKDKRAETGVIGD